MEAATTRPGGPEAPAWSQHQPAYAHGPQYTGRQAQERTSKKALWGFILTLIGFIVAPILFSVIGIALAASARGEMKNDPSLGGRGFTTAALILGPLGIVAGIVVCALMAS